MNRTQPQPVAPEVMTGLPSPPAEIVGARLETLRPTQMSVGMAEVALKQQQWRALDSGEREHLLDSHAFPAVFGPKNRPYITDHHHLGLALLREGVANVRLTIQADFSKLLKDEFWMAMEFRQWVHPFDAHGRKRPIADLPHSLLALRDDPFRSLAAAVRMYGGMAKEQTPFAEFLWAGFFRHRISGQQLRNDPDRALGKALAIAHDKSAMHLPGWSGA
jgi:hypothetical protein